MKINILACSLAFFLISCSTETIILYRFQEGELFGYIDKGGNIIVPARYIYASQFSEGLAYVYDSNYVGFINTRGELEIQFEIQKPQVTTSADSRFSGLKLYVGKTGFWYRDFYFEEDLCPFPDLESYSHIFFVNREEETEAIRWGYLNKSGEFVFNSKYKGADNFSEGLAAVQVDSLWGYIDREGNQVINPQFTSANKFNCNRACNAIMSIEKGLREEDNVPYTSYSIVRVIINKKGQLIGPPMKMSGLLDYSECYAIKISLVKALFGENGYSIIDTNAQDISDDYYAELGDLSEGLLAYKSDLGKWGFIDIHSNVAIPPLYEKTRAFKNGFCAVKDGNWGLIDASGSKIIPCEYDSISDYIEGLIYFEFGQTEKENIFGYMNIQGKTVWHQID